MANVSGWLNYEIFCHYQDADCDSCYKDIFLSVYKYANGGGGRVLNAKG